MNLTSTKTNLSYDMIYHIMTNERRKKAQEYTDLFDSFELTKS